MNRATQLARGAATAAVAVLLAGFSHGFAGGEAPGGAGLALAALVALAASVALVGRRATPVRTALAVVVSQAAFHLLFGVGAGTSTGSFVVSGGVHHSTVAFIDAAGSTGDHGHTDGAMLIGHAIAAAVTIVYLVAVERAAWRAVGAATRRLVLRLTASNVLLVDVALPLVRGTIGSRAPRLRSRLRFTAFGYRGPPALFASA